MSTIIEKIQEDFATEADQKKVIALLTHDNVMELEAIRKDIERKESTEQRVTEMSENPDNKFTLVQKAAILLVVALSAADLIIKNLLDVDPR